MENTNIRLQAMLLVTIIYCLPVRNKTIFFSSCKTCLPIICSKNNETNCSLGKEIYFVQVSFSAKCVYQTLFAEESCQNEANQGYVCFSLKKKRRSKILGFFFLCLVSVFPSKRDGDMIIKLICVISKQEGHATCLTFSTIFVSFISIYFVLRK